MKIPLNSIIQFVQRSTQFIKRSKKTILLILIVSAATLLISTAVSIWLSSFHNLRLASLGTIIVKGAKVYGGDVQNYTQGKLTLDWGIVYPGVPVTRSFNISSDSNVPITLILLDVTSANITFFNSECEIVAETLPIERPITLSSNFNNTTLGPNEVVYATLTLEFSSHPDFLQYLIRNNVTMFSFDIVIVTV